MTYPIFVSSVQKEFQDERRAIKEFVHGDPLCRRYFNVFLFEDLPAADRRADDMYLEEVDRCAIYVALLGNQYSADGGDRLSATEREFDRATEKGTYRLVFIKGPDDERRDPRTVNLIRKAAGQLIRRRYTGTPDLTAKLYASIVEYLEQKHHLASVPFDAAPCYEATLADISARKVRWFLETAHTERNFALSTTTAPDIALKHLNLIRHGAPSHGGILLFGKDPQRRVVSAEVKCLHFHGTSVQKPIPSYQIYKGTLFDQVDQAVDFVLSKLARAVTPGQGTPASDVAYEIPEWVVREAVVNAVAHRDYTSNASVQVMLFSDRLEVWNPGELPAGITPVDLGREHPSIPRNPLVCDPLFLAHYVEKAGTGTLDMIRLCREAGLPEPQFQQRGGQFVVTIWRSWLTDAALNAFGLNDRQKKAVALAKSQGRISNQDYQRETGAIRKTAARDLDDLVQRGLLEKKGAGRGVHYVLVRKRDNNGTSGT